MPAPSEFSRSASRSGPPRAFLALLILLFLGGGALRVWNLDSRGLHTHDEGRFLIVADSYLFAARAVQGGLGADLSALGEVLRARGGSFFAHAKEGHILILALWRLVAGGDDARSALLMAGFSLLAAWLLYRLVRDWTGDRGSGAAAAAVLVFSPFFLHYSRCVLSEADSIALLLGGLFLARRTWVKIQRAAKTEAGDECRVGWGRALGAGVLAGLAFTCHYNKLWAIVIGGGLWAAAVFRSSGTRRTAQRQALTIAAAGFTIPLLSIEFLTLGIKWKAAAAYPGYLTYFGDLWYHFTTFHAHRAAGFGEGTAAAGTAGSTIFAADPLFGFKLLVRWHGWTVALALLISLLIAATRARRDALYLILVCLLVPSFGFFSLYRFQVERSFVGLEPAWAALGGVMWRRGLLALQRRLSGGREPRPALMAWAVCSVIAVVQVPAASVLVHSDASSFKAAALRFAPVLISRGGTVTAGSVTWHARPQWIVYLNQALDRDREDRCRRCPGAPRAADYADWAEEGLGDWLLLEDAQYPDSPLFPAELVSSRSPLITIPSGAFTPRIDIYRLD
ncbi:MAG: hypothetical protein Kow0059_19680 [Candidatus Sumerlaeia bacterium]